MKKFYMEFLLNLTATIIVNHARKLVCCFFNVITHHETSLTQACKYTLLFRRRQKILQRGIVFKGYIRLGFFQSISFPQCCLLFLCLFSCDDQGKEDTTVSMEKYEPLSEFPLCLHFLLYS